MILMLTGQTTTPLAVPENCPGLEMVRADLISYSLLIRLIPTSSLRTRWKWVKSAQVKFKRKVCKHVDTRNENIFKRRSGAQSRIAQTVVGVVSVLTFIFQHHMEHSSPAHFFIISLSQAWLLVHEPNFGFNRSKPVPDSDSMPGSWTRTLRLL